MRMVALLGLLCGGLGVAHADSTKGAASLRCASGRQVMIRDLHNVQVDNTTDGAVIRLKADKPADAQDVQRLARMMVDCMAEGATPAK